MPTSKSGTPKTNKSTRIKDEQPSSVDVSEYLGKLQRNASRIQQEYDIAIKELQVRINKQWTEAATKLNDETRSTQEEIQQQLTEAYRTFIEEFNSAFGKNDSLDDALEAFQNYNTALTDWYSQKQLTARVEKNYLALLGKLRDAQTKPDAQTLSEQAHREYANALNDSWHQSDLTKHLTKAQSKYASLLGKADEVCQKRASEAYKKYVAQTEEILGRPEYTSKYDNSIKNFSSAYGDASNELYKSYTDSYITALQAYQAFQKEAHS